MSTTPVPQIQYKCAKPLFLSLGLIFQSEGGEAGEKWVDLRTTHSATLSLDLSDVFLPGPWES